MFQRARDQDDEGEVNAQKACSPGRKREAEILDDMSPFCPKSQEMF